MSGNVLAFADSSSSFNIFRNSKCLQIFDDQGFVDCFCQCEYVRKYTTNLDEINSCKCILKGILSFVFGLPNRKIFWMFFEQMRAVILALVRSQAVLTKLHELIIHAKN